MLSADLANKKWHLLVRAGKIDFVKPKKIVKSAYLLIVYGQKSNVRTMNRMYNGPLGSAKSFHIEGLRRRSIVHSPLTLCTMLR